MTSFTQSGTSYRIPFPSSFALQSRLLPQWFHGVDVSVESTHWGLSNNLRSYSVASPNLGILRKVDTITNDRSPSFPHFRIEFDVSIVPPSPDPERKSIFLDEGSIDYGNTVANIFDRFDPFDRFPPRTIYYDDDVLDHHPVVAVNTHDIRSQVGCRGLVCR